MTFKEFSGKNVEEAIRAVLAYRREQGMTVPDDAHPEIRRVTVAA